MRRLIGRRRNGGFDSDSTDEEDDSAAEKEYQEPNSVLIKTIAKTSGHTVLVRKPIDLEASSAMKKKLAFEFDQMEREERKRVERDGKRKEAVTKRSQINTATN